MKRFFLLLCLLPSLALAQVSTAAWSIYPGQVTPGGGGGGSGTVTVVSSGSLTSTALVTGGGSQTLQTASSTATMDSSGNISTPGTLTVGNAATTAGAIALTQGTTQSVGTTNITLQAPTGVTSYIRTLPGAVGATGFLLETVAGSVQTESLVPFSGTGNVARVDSPAFTTNFTLANSATPSTTTVAQTAFDTNAWGTNRGAIQVFDGTATTFVVAPLASDTPTNGQVPTWNTGGTVTWETPTGGSASLTATYAGYGDGSNALTGEAAYNYTAATNTLVVGAVTLGAGSEVSSIGPLVDSADGTTPLNNIVETAGAGTAYTLTTSYAALDFGTTDPVIVLPNAGTYTIQAWVQTNLVSATTTTQSVSFKMRRTNNTAADIGSISSNPLPVATVGSPIGPSCVMISTKYTTTNTNDSLTIQGLLSASLGAGTCTVTAARIIAIRAY